jgi:hypothetical protein
MTKKNATLQMSSRSARRMLSRIVGKAERRDTFLLTRHDGSFVRGGRLADFAKHVVLRDSQLQSAFTWKSLAGRAGAVSEGDVYAEMSRCFEWADLLTRCSQALAAVRNRPSFHDLALAPETAQALEDDWPLKPHEAGAVQEWINSVAPRTTTATNAGFLAMMALALRAPWVRPRHILSEPKASRRFRRLAMACSDLAEPPERSGPFKTTRVLLDVYRTKVFDQSAARLVRAHRMYAERLAGASPEAQEAFSAGTGMTLRERIVGLCVLHEVLGRRTRMDFRDASPDEDSILIQVARRLAVPPSWYQSALAGRALHSTISCFRESPIVELSDGQYLVLHQDFLLTAADEGLVRLLRASLDAASRKQLPNLQGDAFQSIVGEALRRCFGEANVIDVPPATKENEKRCDFAVVLGEDLLLLDSKLLTLGDPIIDGTDDVALLMPRLRKGLRQVLNTAKAIRDGGEDNPLGRRNGNWRPRRYFGWLVIQPELPVLYGSRRNLVDLDPDLLRGWNLIMTGLPCLMPIASIERLEAAGQSYVQTLLEFIACDDPRAGEGVQQMLRRLGYRGPDYSELIGAQYLAIIRQARL